MEMINISIMSRFYLNRRHPETTSLVFNVAFMSTGGSSVGFAVRQKTTDIVATEQLRPPPPVAAATATSCPPSHVESQSPVDPLRFCHTRTH